MAKQDLMRYGKFERANVKLGRTDQQATLSIFLVASVLEGKNKRLLQEAKGLDDVVQVVPFHFPYLEIDLFKFYRYCLSIYQNYGCFLEVDSQ